MKHNKRILSIKWVDSNF